MQVMIHVTINTKNKCNVFTYSGVCTSKTEMKVINQQPNLKINIIAFNISKVFAEKKAHTRIIKQYVMLG